MTDLAPLTFMVSKVVLANLAKRSAPINLRPTEYARRLFDAGYTARIAAERGEETGDRALDRQVRDVFLLADCEPDYIADAIGLPVERVQKILDGWRQVARDLRDAPATVEAPAATVASPLPPPAAKKTRKDSYPPDQVETIRSMWADGREVREIAAAIGRTEGALSVWASKHRDVCPSRRGGE